MHFFLPSNLNLVNLLKYAQQTLWNVILSLSLHFFQSSHLRKIQFYHYYTTFGHTMWINSIIIAIKSWLSRINKRSDWLFRENARIRSNRNERERENAMHCEHRFEISFPIIENFIYINCMLNVQVIKEWLNKKKKGVTKTNRFIMQILPHNWCMPNRTHASFIASDTLLVTVNQQQQQREKKYTHMFAGASSESLRERVCDFWAAFSHQKANARTIMIIRERKKIK